MKIDEILQENIPDCLEGLHGLVWSVLDKGHAKDFFLGFRFNRELALIDFHMTFYSELGFPYHIKRIYPVADLYSDFDGFYKMLMHDFDKAIQKELWKGKQDYGFGFKK